MPEKQSNYNLPQDGDAGIGQFFFTKFGIARKEKERLKLNDKMLRNHELVRGKHFKTSSSKTPLLTINLFHTAWSLTKANLTDNKPKFDILPNDSVSVEQAAIMSKAADVWWNRTRQQARLSDTVGNAEKYGTTVEEIIFDKDIDPPIGDVDTKIVDPFRFFPWPGIRDIQKMPFLFEIEIMELADIVRLWPETGLQVKAENEWTQVTGKEREEVKAGTLSGSSSRADANLPNNFVVASTAYGSDKLEKAMVIKCWCKDYTLVVVQEEEVTIDDITGQPVSNIIDRQVPKYPGYIRCVYIANQGNVVLSDMPNPSINPNLPIEQTSRAYLWDKYPYINSNSYTDDMNFWGYSIVEQIEILVMHINKVISMVVAHVEKTAKPALIIPHGCGIELEDISNKPNLVLRPSSIPAAQAIKYLQGANLPSDFFNVLEFLFKLVDTITGIHDVTEGRKPAGVQAASAIMALQEKAETIFRDKIRNLDLLVEERGRMWISMVQNWYTEARKLQVSGMMQQQAGVDFIDYRGSEMTGEYSFEVTSGSTMPKSKYVQREQAIQLFQAQAIDQKALLDAFDYPHKEEIMQRMTMGLVGQAIDRLGKAGMPVEILQNVQAVLSMDDKEFNKTFPSNMVRPNASV